MEGIFGFGRVGIDYFLDNRNTITLTQSFMRANMDPYSKSSIYTDTTSNGTYDNMQQRDVNSENHFRNTSSQLSFKHNFPKGGHEWTVDATYNNGSLKPFPSITK